MTDTTIEDPQLAMLEAQLDHAIGGGAVEYRHPIDGHPRIAVGVAAERHAREALDRYAGNVETDHERWAREQRERDEARAQAMAEAAEQLPDAQQVEDEAAEGLDTVQAEVLERIAPVVEAYRRYVDALGTHNAAARRRAVIAKQATGLAGPGARVRPALTLDEFAKEAARD